LLDLSCPDPITMATVTKRSVVVARRKTSSKLVPAAPEALAKNRKRLAKAFPRPLDKKLKESERVREKFSLPADEYAQLAALKQRLAAQGVAVKKSELLRTGLLLLAELDDGELTVALARLPATV
jgi:hypothetical protein